ncbi:MAG: hypothetical protein J7500_00415 [Sphingomonas sp.]|nr:hypothetical protein [Sphingomonas sp.]
MGRGGEPVAVLDGVFAEPGAIIETVARRGEFSAAPVREGGYPGVQAPAPAAYVRALLAAADEALAQLFGHADGAIGGIGCAFSLVTLRPEQLHPLQTVPHVDIAEEDRFAVLHYLCDQPFGGTAFYRQDATGLEQVKRADWPGYTAARDAALAAHGAHGYPNEATPGYTVTAQIPARMDRMLVYRSNTLHSGIIPADLPHPADPRSGRLTGNLFGIYRRA